MKLKISALIIILLLFLNGCSKELPSEELAGILNEIEDDIEKSSTTIEEFEKIKNVEFATTSPESLLKIMLGSNIIFENFDSKGVIGVSGKKSYTSAVVFKFPDNMQAVKYKLTYESNLQRADYALEERLNYGDLSASFRKSTDQVYVMQKENYLIIVKK